MVWFALTFVTLTAFAGLALEYNRWQQIATRAQKAADAAALGGAVFMPENVGQQGVHDRADDRDAERLHQWLERRDHHHRGRRGCRTSSRSRSRSTRKTRGARWSTTTTTTIVRSAVAEYQLPQNLGSPQNTYGNDPESAAAQPQFWGNVFGPSSNKDKGDAIQAAGPNAQARTVQRRQLQRQHGQEQGLRRQRLLLRHRRAGGYDAARSTCRCSTLRSCTSATTAAPATATPTNSLNNAAALTAAQIPGYRPCRRRSRPRRGTHRRARARSATATTTTATGATPRTRGPSWTLRAPDISTWDPDQQPDRVPGRVPRRLSGDEQRPAERHRRAPPSWRPCCSSRRTTRARIRRARSPRSSGSG